MRLEIFFISFVYFFSLDITVIQKDESTLFYFTLTMYLVNNKVFAFI